MSGIKGTIRDDKTGEALKNVLIIIDPEDEKTHTFTDEKGRYKINGLEVGRHYQVGIVPTYGQYKRFRDTFEVYEDHGEATNYTIRDYSLIECEEDE